MEKIKIPTKVGRKPKTIFVYKRETFQTLKKK